MRVVDAMLSIPATTHERTPVLRQTGDGGRDNRLSSRGRGVWAWRRSRTRRRPAVAYLWCCSVAMRCDAMDATSLDTRTSEGNCRASKSRIADCETMAAEMQVIGQRPTAPEVTRRRESKLCTRATVWLLLFRDGEGCGVGVRVSTRAEDGQDGADVSEETQRRDGWFVRPVPPNSADCALSVGDRCVALRCAAMRCDATARDRLNKSFVKDDDDVSNTAQMRAEDQK